MIEEGADVNAKDKDCDTPLLCASRKKNTDVCRLLVEEGASIGAPLFRAVVECDIYAASSLLYAVVAQQGCFHVYCSRCSSGDLLLCRGDTENIVIANPSD